jgi:predicted nucleic acid-binding Zn ribbon protein
MKKAGDLLSLILDNRIFEKAQGYSELFLSWELLTEENNIPAAAAYSRIKELEGSVLLVEADHPGWIQILSNKQKELLAGIRRRFPQLSVTELSFRLSRDRV